MKLTTDVFDLWVFTRQRTEPTYLLLRTSQQKADRWFGRGRFWQIPGDASPDDEHIVVAIDRLLSQLELRADALFATEHVYPIFNRRVDGLQLIPAFAAEIKAEVSPRLTWEHSEYGWFSASECSTRLSFRGLLEGLEHVRRHVTEVDAPRPELRLR
jgi:hypothetical protein